jgi:N-acetylmuramoyl-L-alanine amidase
MATGKVIGIILPDNLNIRDRGNMLGKVIGHIPNGDYFTLVQNGTWCKIIYKGITGYVYSKYIQGVSTDRYKVVNVVSTDTLNMRDKPNMVGSVISKIPYNAEVDILATGEWLRVCYNGHVGYVYSKYLQDLTPPVVTPPTNPPVPTRTRVALLDAGHFANHNRGAAAGYWEGNWNLAYAFLLKTELEALGWKVYMTRTDGRDLGLITRGAMARKYKADLFYSIHSNACGSQSVRGCGAFYSIDLPQNKAWANAMAKCVAQVMGSPKYYAKVRIGGTKSKADPSTSEDYYSVIDSSQDVGTKNVILLEHDFHTNRAVCYWLSDKDASGKWIINKAHCTAMAKAEAATINKYIV